MPEKITTQLKQVGGRFPIVFPIQIKNGFSHYHTYNKREFRLNRPQINNSFFCAEILVYRLCNERKERPTVIASSFYRLEKTI